MTTQTGPHHYALHDPETGAWFYYLSEIGYGYGDPRVVGHLRLSTLTVDLTPVEKRGWYTSPEKLEQISVFVAGNRPVTGYVRRAELSEDFAHLPERLTPTEYRAKAGLADLDDNEVDATSRLYRATYQPEYGEAPLKRTDHDVSTFTVLEGQPKGAVPKGATWKASLPIELREHPEYQHLFSGELTGFAGALAEHLSALPGVSAYNQSTFSIYVKVGGLTKELVKDRSVPAPPWSFKGANLAEAVEKWEQALADYERKVTDTMGTGPCSACQGTGVSRSVPDEALIADLTAAFRANAGRSKTAAQFASQWARIAVQRLRG